MQIKQAQRKRSKNLIIYLMELIPVKSIASPEVAKRSRDSFIRANTVSIEADRLKSESIIPVFAKDNESTISHSQFIEAIHETASQFFIEASKSFWLA